MAGIGKSEIIQELTAGATEVHRVACDLTTVEELPMP
jgi:hypothetical protein